MKIDNEIRTFGKNNKVPITLDDTLNFLVDLINKNNYKSILEIGTAIGYGCITIAENTKCESIVSVEIDKERFDIATQNIQTHNLQNKIKLVNDDAMNFIKIKKQKYDLIYLDGPKNQYINYLPYLVKMLNPNGAIVADNLYFHGMVLGKTPVTAGCRAMIRSLHRYIAEITTNPKLETIIYEIGDGVGVTKKK